MTDPSGWRRWWVYQRERFPLNGHVPLILTFSLCAVAFSAHLRGVRWPAFQSSAVAFATSLMFFLQLRIADEFKDAEEDARWRPYRPVPRGLVQLRELGILFLFCAAVQLGLALWWSPKQIVLLLIAWAYLAAMSVEFGCRAWLKRRPVVYLLSHMLMLPIIDLYATACDWMPAQGMPPDGLGFFLAASFSNGLIIELGRKIRSPADEELGVETYSFLWGPKRAIVIWLGAVGLTFIFAVLAAREAGAAVPVGIVLGVSFLWRAAFIFWFQRYHRAGRGAWVEIVSGLWSLVLYISLGALPLIFGRSHG